MMSPRPHNLGWDEKRIGAGGVPIETPDGWLVLYHAYDNRHVYRLSAAMLDLASASLHYSPEPAVIERLIESEVMLGMDDAAVLDLARFKAAFPKEHEAWALSNARGLAQKAP